MQEQYANEIRSSVDELVLQLGSVLHRAALVTGRERYETWIAESLPFDVRTARRIRAIYLAYQELPAEMLADFPAPRSALFAKQDMP